ncbi:MAG TPA: plastocyanin/azurin family copper-binding protein [Solirubrobacteraceae bacterium]|jgi:plastocyanin
MHTAALHLAPILGAEKSKVPFYIAGGLLVVWALFISMAVGMRQPNFPSTIGQQRVVIAISAVLVVVAASMAVVTSGGDSAGSAKAAAVSTQTTSSGAETPVEGPPVGAEPAPASSSEESPSPSTSSTSTGEATATTGTPPPASSPAAKSSGGSALKLAAAPGGELSYNTKTLTAKAGKVTIEMTNMSPVEHNVTVAEGTKVLGATPSFVGGSKTLTLTLKPGKYTFYCSVPGHRQAGMEGTLTVS